MKFQCSIRFHGLSPIRNISYLLPVCCSFWEKCLNSQKYGLGCSTPLSQYLLENGIWVIAQEKAIGKSTGIRSPRRCNVLVSGNTGVVFTSIPRCCICISYLPVTTHRDSSDRLLRSHIMQYRCGYCKLEYLWRYYEGTLTILWKKPLHMQ